jgi:hypothetical protein
MLASKQKRCHEDDESTRLIKSGGGNAGYKEQHGERGSAADVDAPEKHREHRNALITHSERTFGRKRRRIDGWVDRARDGYY